MVVSKTVHLDVDNESMPGVERGLTLSRHFFHEERIILISPVLKIALCGQTHFSLWSKRRILRRTVVNFLSEHKNCFWHEQLTWDPGGHEKQFNETECNSFKREIRLWVLKFPTILISETSEEDDEPHKSQTTNMTGKMPEIIDMKLKLLWRWVCNIKTRLKLLWQWVFNHATKKIVSKSVSKHTRTGVFTLNPSTRLNKSYTLVFFIEFAEWIGETNPVSKKGSKNNKEDIRDSVHILQVRAQLLTWNIAMSVDGDGSGLPHHPPDTIKTKHSRRLLGVIQITLNDSTAYWQSLQIYDYILWSLTLKKALSVDGDGFEPPHHPPDTIKDRHVKLLGVTHSTLKGSAKRLGLHFYDYPLWSVYVCENGKLAYGDYPGPPNEPLETTDPNQLESLQEALFSENFRKFLHSIPTPPPATLGTPTGPKMAHRREPAMRYNGAGLGPIWPGVNKGASEEGVALDEGVSPKSSTNVRTDAEVMGE